MRESDTIVFLLDVDNTLLDNDQVTEDLKEHLARAFGRQCQQRYWEVFETLRGELGYTDWLGALQQYRLQNPHDPNIVRMSSYLLDYPFADRLFPGALEVVRHLGSWGTTVILSDGDAVFQPRKIQRCGLYEAVDGRVLIYIHKELELDDVRRRYPADHYVLVDDKPRILAAVKGVWREGVTTVFPRQGHYAHDEQALAKYPPADITIEHIGDLLHYDAPATWAYWPVSR